ncbi:F-actin-monooxygenase mical1 isoform X2 [Lepisosteus oculatus]|uniref:F-actin-monooxygenase mical1 isoform X2 n=1 Tax=Lepisosteus oculatus TaxID=7918 RepID=UPI00370FC6CA
MAPQESQNPSHCLFDRFTNAQRCKDVLASFAELCRHLEVDPHDYRHFYSKLKDRLNYWKAKAIWTKLDKRAEHPDYQQGQACVKNRCLVLGAGPCGLRTAIELAFLGAKVVLIEKRDTFSRNNVLHLWPYTIHDLRGLAAKKFYGKFCSGTLDHISIRQLQLILLKVALILGVEVHTCVDYKGLIEPHLIDSQGATGWRADVLPASHPVRQFHFDVFISAGGGRFVPKGFKRKEMRGKLAIGITANFVNHHTAEEAQVSEISGVARIYNQKFFQSLHNETGIDLENIVYYKDDTHYFVMTAKKKSLLSKGVIKQDHSDAEKLLSPQNVNAEALRHYAYEAAHFSTNRQLPGLEFALNHARQPDVAMFDFTCMFRAEAASLVWERGGSRLLICLVGDCLVEPFWPLGTGIARGFLAAFDAAWMVKRWGKGTPPLEVLAERESLYQLLSQTTPENTSKNYSAYSIDPTTRYPNINLGSIKPSQVRHLCDVEDQLDGHRASRNQERPQHTRQDSVGGYEELLIWCQQHTAGYKNVKVMDLTLSWRSGLALCALIHHFLPDLIDFASLGEANIAYNNQLAFDVAQRELGITPIMSGTDMAAKSHPDKLAMVLYLTEFYNAFRETATPPEDNKILPATKPISLSSAKSAIFFLSKLKHNSLQRRKQKMAAEKEEKEKAKITEKKAKLSPVSPGGLGSSEVCYFCGDRVYVLERVSAEGKFFHRSCFCCKQCGVTLRLGSYSFDNQTGEFFCMQHSEDWPLDSEREPADTQDCVDHRQPDSQTVDRSDREHQTEIICVPPCRDYDVTDHPEIVHFPVTKPPVDSLPEDQCPVRAGEGEHADAGGSVTVSAVAVMSSTDGPKEDGSATQRPVPAVRTSRLRSQATITGSGGLVEETSLNRTNLDSTGPPVPKPRTLVLRKPAVPSLEVTHNERESIQKEDKCIEAWEADHSGEGSIPMLIESCEVDHGGQSSLKETTMENPPGPPLFKDGPESENAERHDAPTLKKLQLTEEEKMRLTRLSFSVDFEDQNPSEPQPAGDSEDTPDLLAPDQPAGESGHWSGLGGGIRDHSNRKSFRRKEEQTAQAPVETQATPSPQSTPKFSQIQETMVGDRTLVTQETDFYQSEDDDDDEEDDDVFTGDADFDPLYDERFQRIPSDPLEAEKLELLKMRTLERHAKMCELQRFHRAQSIQRRLEEIEVTFKELEEKGIVLERTLRGEIGSDGSPEILNKWIQLVHEKNALVSEESDLMVASRQLELEDKQSGLEKELRSYIEMSDSVKTPQQKAKEEMVLKEMLKVVDERNELVTFLEEQRLKEINDCLHGLAVLDPKRPTSGGAQVHWA